MCMYEVKMCDNITESMDSVDPRVHIELERLNNATDEINRLESDLDTARSAFRSLLCDSTARIDALRLKLGLCVERAKPYYEARFCANEALKQTQLAAMKYEKANSAHSAAREMVYLAEQGLGGRTLDPAWQEMLNHATQRVNESEHDRGLAAEEHKVTCVKHEAANMKVKMLQKELKRAISKSRPYYEMKAHYNQLLEKQRSRIQNFEVQISTAKLNYSEALRNLEEISDEIHRRRNSRRSHPLEQLKKQTSMDSNESYVDVDFNEEFKSLPTKLSAFPLPTQHLNDDIEGYKSISYNNSASTPTSQEAENLIHPNSQSSEWTEINLDVSSPEEECIEDDKPKLIRQRTLPNPSTDNEFKSFKGRSKLKLDSSISTWLSRSSAAKDYGSRDDASINSRLGLFACTGGTSQFVAGRRQSLDNILGPTSEKVKEIWSQGMMMLNISSLTERRNSEPRACLIEGKTSKKLPSPLEKTLTYLNVEDDTSDTESLSSIDMLNEEQINSLMLDKEISLVCEEVLGTPINEIVTLPNQQTEVFPPANLEVNGEPSNK